MGVFKRTAKPATAATPAKKVRLADALTAACNTSQEDMERIVNGATVPQGTPAWQVTTRTGRTGRR